jgi:epoxyqueuosine reductase
MIAELARELGFARAAVVPIEPPRRHELYASWLAAGRAGEMHYLAAPEHVAGRADLRSLLATARSLVVVALALDRRDPVIPAGHLLRGRIARYARGEDYHLVMRDRLVALAAAIAERANAAVASRPCVDSAPILEREWAERGGLGFIAKNTMLIAPGLGSHVMLGELLVDAELTVTAPDAPPRPRCGSCRACLDACPTSAFADAYVLDARRCISYLTIEHRGDVDEALRPLLGRWAFGCDVCQDVCPWNRRAAAAREPAFAPAGAFDRPESLLELDASAFRARFRGTALLRAKRSGLLRNLALLLGNRREAGAVGPLRRALDDEDGVVRRAAAWALARIGAPEPPRPPSPSG